MDGKHIAGFYNTFDKFKTQFKKTVDKQEDGKLKDALKEVLNGWVFKNLPGIGVGIGLVDLFIGGGRKKKKESPVPMVFTGDMTLSGTLKERNFITEFSIRTPGAHHQLPNFTPLYDYPLGILNLNTTPVLQARHYWQRTAPNQTMYYSSYRVKNDLDWVVNPHSGLQLRDMEAAVVFRLHEAYTYPYELLPVVPESLDSGNYEIESSTDGKYVLRTRYIPYHHFKDTVITVPPETDITIKIKAVLERIDEPEETQPVLFVADYEPVFEQDSIMNSFPWSPYQLPSTPPTVEIVRPAEDVLPVSTPLLFSCRSDGGPVDRYEWDFGDGTDYEYGQTVVHTYQDEGLHTATVTATGPGGIDIQSITILVYGVPWLENPGFEDGLDFWRIYGDGFVEVTTQAAFTGSSGAHIERTLATGRYFGLYQEDIAVEPNTEYRLTLWVKTDATSGRAVAALGVWSSDPASNHHTDFGHISGTTDWVQITGTWKSRPDERVIQVVLYGSPDFVGEAYFDDLVVEEVKPKNGGFEKGLKHWESYGDGTTYETVSGGVEGVDCASFSRDGATGRYFGLVQRDIPCEPHTTYRLTLWISTDSDSGHAAAGLGNWGSPNTHKDFGWSGGYTDWTQISATWTSRWDETSMDIVLYGSTQFSGRAYFDELVLEKVGPAPLGVAIHNPWSLGYKERGDYIAEVAQGSGEYRYEWARKEDGSTAWYLLGGREHIQRCMMFDSGFSLRVNVTDIITGAQGTATRYIEYEGDGRYKRIKELE
jgi:PKD repeat protein